MRGHVVEVFLILLVILAFIGFWGILWDVAGRIFVFWPLRFILALMLIPFLFPWVFIIWLLMSKKSR